MLTPSVWEPGHPDKLGYLTEAGCACMRQWTRSSLYPRSTEGGMGVYWIHPDVCLSVCPSVCRQGFRNFLKKLLAQFISYLAFTLMGWVPWPPIHFRVPSLIFGPLVAKYLAGNGVSGTFWKTIRSIHFILGIYPYGVSLLTPIHFLVPSLILVPWWPNIWPKMAFWELFEKIIGSIHFIPGIYLLTPIYFRVSSLIFGPLVAKYLCYNGTWLYLFVFLV